jgi:hypothetical protein
MYVLDPARSSFVIETLPTGMLARLGHDLRMDARGASGRILDDTHAEARFPVDSVRVLESKRHGTATWGPPPGRDTEEIEDRLRDQVFPRLPAFTLKATLDGAHAELEVTARGTWKGRVPVSVKHSEGTVEVSGTATLSLRALGGEQPRIPLGALQLEDALVVRFHAVFAG